MDYKTCLILLTSFLFSHCCYGELKDPTKPASYSPNMEKKSPKANVLNLSSIWVSGISKRVTINGITAKQGKLILSNVRIIEIFNHSVVISQNGKKQKLYLLNSASNLSKTAFQ